MDLNFQKDLIVKNVADVFFCNLDAIDIDNDCCMASEDNICPFHGNKDNIEL